MDHLSNCQFSPRPPKGGFFHGARSQAGFAKQMMTWLFLIFLFLQGSVYAQLKRVPVLKPKGGFEIDGNLGSSNMLPANGGPGGDWFSPMFTAPNDSAVFWFNGSNIIPLDASVSLFKPDNFGSSDDIFTQGTKSNDDPSVWKWTTGSATGKGDIGSGLLHIGTDENDSTWLFVASDRLVTNGTSYLEFEFFQETVVKTGTTSGGFTGTRSKNDILISISYVNGGAVSDIKFYLWDGSSYIESTVTSGKAYGFVNNVQINTPGGGFGQGNYQALQFVEAALNITAILGDALSCVDGGVSIKTLMIKTRTSSSISAAADDFINPIAVRINFGTAEVSYDESLLCTEETVSPDIIGVQGGTFTVSPLSGLVIDSEGVINVKESVPGEYKVTYTYTSSGCVFTYDTVVIIPKKAPAPDPKTFDFCQGTGIQSLTVEPAMGYTIKWYDSDKNPLPGAPTDISTATPGTLTYYITQIKEFKDGEECERESNMATVTVTVDPAPVAPVSGGNQVFCEQSPIQTLTATATVPPGFSVVWYSEAIGGSPVSPTLNTVGTVTYYAEAVNNETMCKSLTRTAVSLTIQPAPAAPVSGGDQVSCQQSPIQTLTATATVPQGFSVVWYSGATGGSPVNPTLNTVGTITYYAEAVNNQTQCKSLTRTAVNLTIQPAPAAPVSGGNQEQCQSDPIQTLTATATVPQGFSIVWYSAAIDGNVVANPTLNSVGTVTYYAETVNNQTQCKSLTRTAVTLTIQPAPAAPVSGGNQVQCQASPIQTLTATATVPQGFSVVWYSGAIGGSPVNPTLNTVGTITYYAEAVNNQTQCKSLTRTAVNLTIQPAPAAPVSGGDQIACETIASQNLVATASVPAGFSVVWFNQAVGGNLVANPSLSSVGTVTYYAQAVNNQTDCPSLTRTPVTLTIVQGPTPPTSGGNQEVCATFPVQTLTATATSPGTLVWYNAPIGGDVVANPILNTVGSVTYYAQTVDGSCASLQRTPVTLTILPAPVAPVSGGNQVACASSGVESLTATASVPAGFSIVWYNAPTGGNVVQNPSINAVSSVTYYAEAVNNQTGCTSNSRTPVTLTIFNCDISIDKTSAVSEVDAAGDVIDYTLTVTNTGNVTLTNVTVVDPLTGLNQNIGSLAAGESTQLSTSYTVTQADMDSGEIENLATVTALGPDESQVSAEDDAVVKAIQNPSLDVEISDNDAVITKAGQEIGYTITVTNTGNVTLENVTVVDSKTGTEVNVGSLAPGESKQVETIGYPVTQEDVDAGKVINEATATGESPNSGDNKPTAVDEVTTPIAQLPSVQILKKSDKASLFGAGETVTYTLTVSNTGNVTLTGVKVTDPLTGLEETVEVLAPGQSVVFETKYVATLADMAAGSVSNVATVKATAPDGKEVTDTDGVTIGAGKKEIIANDDEFGSYFLRYGGPIGNILDNDRLDGVRPDPADVDFEFTELDGIVGLLINDNGVLSLIPNVNQIKDYKLKYVLRETVNPTNTDDAFVFFRILNNDADLKVTKQALSDDVFEGDVFDYQIVVSNVGKTDAINVVVTDNIPSGVTYQSYTVTANTSGSQVTATVSGNNVRFAIPFMGPGTSVTIQIRVKAGAAGTVINTAVVSSDEDDINEEDNDESDQTEIKPFRIPNVITPNGDGKNDTFEIQGLGKYSSNRLVIFNRYGDHVLERENYGNDWDAPDQVAGTYFYVLVVTDPAGNTTEFKGWIQVIKE